MVASTGHNEYFNSLRVIAGQVALDLGLTMKEMHERTHLHRVSHARQEAFRRQYAAGHSLPKIARWWGYDHTTVLWGIRSAEKRRKS